MGKKKHSFGHAKNHKKTRIIRGQISINSKGTGYVEAEGFRDDIEISSQFIKTALHGDTVEIEVLSGRHSKRTQGKILRVLERVKTDFVGVVEEERGAFFLKPDNKKIHRDILIIDKNINKNIVGQKILVRMYPWTDQNKNPEGEILKVIGKKGVHEVEIQSIILDKGFDSDFPAEVEKEAKAVAETEKARLEEEAGRRKDFRKTLTFTIDPIDAKDFDDAISFKEIRNGEYEVGVHIADVSHYVREGGALDREARKRGFSVYLVDRTIPMLPEILSNDLCSLNPNEDRLSFSAVFIIKKTGHNNFSVTDRWFGKTIIHSNKRFSYESAQLSLINKMAEYSKELTTLNTIAKYFRSEKLKNGAIDFEKEEIKFKLDPNGVPIEIIKKERLDTHKLIEEFMLLANREVAEFLSKMMPKGKSSSLYRVHDTPDKEKIAQLGIFLKALGYDLKIHDGKITAESIAKMLRFIEGKPAEDLIKTATLRAMAKAIYSTKNIGHFGLGFTHYTHFTSPIRRYADLIIHRLLNRHLTKGKIRQDELAYLDKIAAETSEKEVAAAEAERASIKYKQVEYMSRHIGETFDAVISGVTEWGIFVEETETKSEGMVRISSLSGDFYTLNEKNYSLTGKDSKKKFSLGDKVRVKLVNADLDKKSLDFEIM